MVKNRIVAALTGLMLFCISAVSYAALPGYYFSGQIGWGDLHYDVGDFGGANNVAILGSGEIDNTGLAGRIAAGFQMSPYLGIELGYTQFSNAHIKEINGIDGLNGSISENAGDLSAKLSLPLGKYFDVNGRLGYAYVNANAHGAVDGTEHRFSPTFGAGLAWWATANVPIEASWTRIQNIGGNIPATDLFALGVAYYFG